MTVVLDGTDPAELAVDGPGARRRRAGCPRAGAFAFDVIIPLSVAAVPPCSFRRRARAAVVWLYRRGGRVLFAMAVNRLVLPAITGWSVGESLFTASVSSCTGDQVKPRLLILRDMAHVLDTVSCSCWLWPLRDSRQNVRRPSFSGCRVGRSSAWCHNASGPVNMLGAAVAVVVDFREVYRTQKAVDRQASRARRSSSKCSSYEVATLQDDFARAQSLAADNYRHSSSRSSRRWKAGPCRQ